MWKMTFQFFLKSQLFESPWERKNWRIGLQFGTHLEGPKKRSLLTSHFWTMVLVWSIKNVFRKITNSIFPQNYTRYGKNVKNRNCLFCIKIYIFADDHFFKGFISRIGHVVSVLVVKNVILKWRAFLWFWSAQKSLLITLITFFDWTKIRKVTLC